MVTIIIMDMKTYEHIFKNCSMFYGINWFIFILSAYDVGYFPDNK